MKILGHTDYGYLIELSAFEMERLSGQRDSSLAYGQKHHVGKTFDISKAVDQVHALTAAAGHAKSGAGYLRALADQLDRENPKWICEPEAQVKP